MTSAVHSRLSDTSPAPGEAQQCVWAPWAWVNGSWQASVLLDIDARGHWAAITPGAPPPEHACCVSAPVLPGLVNAHSHAFQRAFAGQTERRTQGQDDFWSWRDRMYGVALSLTPPDLERWATRLYGELLAGGYTQVCEFHYLHHQPDGLPHADELAMARALINAAETTGIGLTLLPVMYERAGFGQPQLRADQRRFAAGAADVLRMFHSVRAAASPRLTAGVAIHSLRAAHPGSIDGLLRGLEHHEVPIHIHVAEQTAEVKDCIAATGLRPIEWLQQHARLDRRWQLVHATHTVGSEIDAVAAAGAGVVICPSTEANLGDGLPDTPHWLRSGAGIAIGSDSQVTRAWPEELRWLEYGQRLIRQQRNVCADPERYAGSSAAHLFERCLQGGGRAAGLPAWGLAVGARADLLLVDSTDTSLAEQPTDLLLDTLVFSSPGRAFAGVMVAGRWALQPRMAGESPRRAG